MAMQGPDRGFSWVIVFCCSYIHFALFGLFRSSGVMYVAMLQNYDVTREEASWPFSLCAAVFQLVGPVASVLTHYVSQRKVCLLGSAVATFGVGACYFADNVMWINMFYGLVHGLGFGFVVTVVPVTLSQYFVKHRATAMGIAFSGGTVSSLIFPSVMEWLLENYTLRDSFLLLSGVVMNTLVASSLMREPSWLKKAKHPPQDSTAAALVIEGNGCPLMDSPAAIVNSSNMDHKHSGPEMEPFPNDKSRNDVPCDPDSALIDAPVGKASGQEPTVNITHRDALHKDEFEVKEPLLNDKKIVIVPKKTTDPAEPKGGHSICHSISEVFKEPIFHLITFTMCVYFLSVHSFFMVIVDFAKDKGIPEGKAIYIISMFSLTDMFGRAGLGWVTDRNFISRKTMVALNLGILGVVNQLYPLIDSLEGILAVSAIHGLSVGSSITLFFVLQAECLGMDRLALVVGLISFINGIASLFRPGIIGLFRDVIGTYDWMFHFLGFLTMMFSVLWLVESLRSKETNTSKRPQGGKV